MHLPKFLRYALLVATGQWLLLGIAAFNDLTSWQAADDETQPKP